MTVGLYESPSEAFREPYAARVGTVVDGDHQVQEIAKALPPTDLRHGGRVEPTRRTMHGPLA